MVNDIREVLLTKEEIESLPMGNKIYKVLEKAKIY